MQRGTETNTLFMLREKIKILTLKLKKYKKTTIFASRVIAYIESVSAAFCGDEKLKSKSWRDLRIGQNS